VGRERCSLGCNTQHADLFFALVHKQALEGEVPLCRTLANESQQALQGGLVAGKAGLSPGAISGGLPTRCNDWHRAHVCLAKMPVTCCPLQLKGSRHMNCQRSESQHSRVTTQQHWRSSEHLKSRYTHVRRHAQNWLTLLQPLVSVELIVCPATSLWLMFTCCSPSTTATPAYDVLPAQQPCGLSDLHQCSCPACLPACLPACHALAMPQNHIGTCQ
jgi:hypothetical protein